MDETERALWKASVLDPVLPTLEGEQGPLCVEIQFSPDLLPAPWMPDPSHHRRGLLALEYPCMGFAVSPAPLEDRIPLPILYPSADKLL